MSRKWKRIEDLPRNWQELTEGELAPLLTYWRDQREMLAASGALAGFQQRLVREWSIETGQIEGVYDLDRGVTQTLIERGINAELMPHIAGQRPPEMVAAIIRDHADVLEGLFQFVDGARLLSKGYIHELHAALLRHQDTATVIDQFGHFFETDVLRGRYKQRPNNPTRPDGTIHEYCPPEHVESEMERLIDMHQQHDAARVPVEVEAAWLHHRFAQIHPYQDGNGRVARSLASALFLRAGWFPLVITRDDRVRYIDSLEVADESDLQALVALFVDVEKRSLFQAANAAADAVPAATVEDAIAAAQKVLLAPDRAFEPAVWRIAKETADRIMALAVARLDDLANGLSSSIGKERSEWGFYTGLCFPTVPLPEEQITYRPNYDDYERQETLSLKSEGTARIVVAAHAVGSRFKGLIAILVLFEPRGGSPVALASDSPFQVNYAEPYESAERRFRPWLERSLIRALELWRKSL